MSTNSEETRSEALDIPTSLAGNASEDFTRSTTPSGHAKPPRMDSISILLKDNARAIGTCVLYATLSVCTTLTNKGVGAFGFKTAYIVLYWQALVTVLGLLLARHFGVIKFDMPRWDDVRAWIPLNLIFCLMLLSNTYALWYISVPMITVIKSFSTVFIGLGDAFLFGQPATKGVYASMCIMVVSSIIAGFNDLSFNAYGYIWAGINCLAAVAYALYMRFALKSTGVKEFAAVFLNNALPLISLLPFILFSGDIGKATTFINEGKFTFGFFLFMLLNGASGCGISIASWLCVGATSPTTYSMVGALNKIPLMFIGWIIFGAPMTTLGACSVCCGLAGSILYTYCKAMMKKKASQQK